MKNKLIKYLEYQIDYHEETLATEGYGIIDSGDKDVIKNTKKDIKQLKSFIKWLEKQ